MGLETDWGLDGGREVDHRDPKVGRYPGSCDLVDRRHGRPKLSAILVPI